MTTEGAHEQVGFGFDVSGTMDIDDPDEEEHQARAIHG
jgi:hypothetical protein